MSGEAEGTETWLEAIFMSVLPLINVSLQYSFSFLNIVILCSIVMSCKK